MGIADQYYDRLPPYMAGIFQLTQRAVSEGEESVAQQALEFWCTLCEEEIDRLDQVGGVGWVG